MSIVGVKSLIYGADDPGECIRFYEDFGLPRQDSDPAGADFMLEDGASVLVRSNDDPNLPERFTTHPGVRELIWGVDSQSSLDAIADDLSRDRQVDVTDDGTLHTVDDLGIAIGFSVFNRRLIETEKARENTPGEINRWDSHRKWYERACPKTINHIGWAVPEIDAVLPFYVNRLNFRVTDISQNVGIFLRCNGRNEHHNVFLRETKKDLRWHHVCFGVENIDEMMAGANLMQVRGWKTRRGLGRHRIASALEYYLNNPAGGDSEYGADTDYLTDDWKPRLWEPVFGNNFWYGNVPENVKSLPEWKVRVLDQPVESFHQFDDATF